MNACTPPSRPGARRRLARRTVVLIALASLALPAGLTAGVSLLGTASAGAATTSAATLYVTKGGSDAGNTSCALATPCATIAHALSLAVPGDVVSVGPGTFAGHVNVGTNLTLKGAGATRTIIAGPKEPKPTLTAEVTVDAGVHATISDLTVTGGALATEPTPTVPSGQSGGISASTGALTLVGVSVRKVSALAPAAVNVEPNGIPNCHGAGGQEVLTTTTPNGFAGLSVGETVSIRQIALTFTVTSVTSPTSITLSRPLLGALWDATLVVGARSSATSTVAIVDSTIYNPPGTASGASSGIVVASPLSQSPASTLMVANSTIDGTRTGNVDFDSGIAAIHTAVTAVNDTIVDNINGLYLSPTSTLAMGNTILTATSYACHSPQSSVTDEGHNIVSGTQAGGCNFANGDNGDQVGTFTVKVGPVSDNGGTVPTAALLPGSPAIGAGSATLCAAAPVNGLDERGDARNQGTRAVCDVGAYDTGGTHLATLYVTKGGSDAGNTSCALATPCATIAHALSLAVPGDVVSVGPGTFAGHVNVGTNLTLKGAGATRTIIAGPKEPKPTLTAEVTVDAGVHATISDLTVTGGALATEPTPTVPSGQSGGISASTGALTLVGVSVRKVSALAPAAVNVEPNGIPNCHGAGGQEVLTTTTPNGFAGLSVGETVSIRQIALTFTVTSVTSPTSITLSRPLLGALWDATLVVGARSSATSTVAIVDSTIYNPPGTASGASSGIVVASPLSQSPASTLMVANSTIDGTRTGNVDFDSGIAAIHTAVTAVNDTIVDNINGLYLSPTSTLAMGNTILTATSYACHSPQSSVTDEGHNIVSGTQAGGCNFANGDNGDQVGTFTVKVGPVSDNGGTVPTAALLPGSPAIGAGSATLCAAAPVNGLDERGDARNQGTRAVCDVGAYDTGGLPFSETAITSVTNKPKVGQPITVAVAVEDAAGAGGAAPTGKVMVAGGTKSCQATLTATTTGRAAGSCRLTLSTPGTFSFTASYPGSSGYQPSETATTVTVTDPTTTTLTLSASSVTRGEETTETFAVSVSARTGTPTGTVEVKAGSKILCQATLAAGTGTCSPGPDALAVGTAKVVASYAATTVFDASKSAAHTLTVTKA